MAVNIAIIIFCCLSYITQKYQKGSPSLLIFLLKGVKMLENENNDMIKFNNTKDPLVDKNLIL